MRGKEAAKRLLTICGGCKEEEKILIVTDPTSKVVADAVWEASSYIKNRSMIVMDETVMHGADPNPMVAAAMGAADVIFGCTKFSLFHAPAKKAAVAAGARFVNMVDYCPEMLEKGGLYCDFEANGQTCLRIADALRGKKTCRITTSLGTDFTCSIEGIEPTPQLGRSLHPGESSSPPDIECATCAREGTGEGVVYIDGSIPHPRLGLIHSPIRLTVEKGRIVRIEGGEQAAILEQILQEFGDPKVYQLGEIGLGLNPLCQLTGRMLEDEGCSGTVHFGCGDNTGFGGRTASRIHLDLVFQKPSLWADEVQLLEEGRVLV
ncbi:aminopeptidase [Hominifimenecus sp. rT4P-3]|uniref:aminopeptidase n=1 Tax=Hominifimenecus sp. rT4P-3 TaxID=3242979 RepID=UPI003DA54BBB